MRKLLTSSIFSGVAVAGAIALSAPPAFAASFHVEGARADGTNNGEAGTTTLTVVHGGGSTTELACQTSSAASTGLNNGDSDGQPIAQITGLSFNNCSFAGIFSFTVSTSGFPWDLDAINESPADHINGTINGSITAHIHSDDIPCDADVVGTTVPGFYLNPAVQGVGLLVIPGTGQDLTIANVDPARNCGGQINNNESASFTTQDGNAANGDEGFLINPEDPFVTITQTG